jgi:hypothetical protein
MTALIETSSDRWTRIIRSTGVVGLITFVVLFTALIASTPGEPPFLASPEEALAFYLNSTAGRVQAAMAVVSLAAIGWIWFVVGLCLLLARAEGSPPLRTAVALDLDDHHVHPACPQAARGAGGGRRASQP